MRKKKYIFSLLASLAMVTMLTLPAASVGAELPPPIPVEDWNPEYTPQVHWPGADIATAGGQFVSPLPLLNLGDLDADGIQTIVDTGSPINVNMEEFKANILPEELPLPNDGTYSGTYVWGYVLDGTDTALVRDTYTGPVVVATRGDPTTMKFTNMLGSAATTNVLSYKYSIDQSLHWANPDGMAAPKYVNIGTVENPIWVGNPDHYEGYVPAAVHLHGAEDPANVDGGPDAWFTAMGQHGATFYSEGWNGSDPIPYSIYTYPNVQEAAPLWFHDHTLGATRLNVFAGLAGAYVLRDPDLVLPAGLTDLGLDRDPNSPAGDEFLIPLVVQDRMFDTNGQLLYNTAPNAADPQNVGINPDHPYWTPEFFGDTVAVNGKVWPYLDVQGQRYRFLAIGGANARTWELSFSANFTDTTVVPEIWQVATDQGYLDEPVQVDPLVIMPGERAEFIVDFTGFEGQNLILHNLGPDDPFNGIIGVTDPTDPDYQEPADPITTGVVMQFRVGTDPVSDSSYDPAADGDIRTGGQEIVRLVDPITGTIDEDVTVAKTRELVLVEIARDDPSTVNGIDFEGGPTEVLVNNTKWMGTRPDETNPNVMTMDVVNGGVPDGLGNYLTELPHEGDTEVWEIVNMTMDAHPIHTHLAQFQLLNRQAVMGDPDMGGGFWAAYEDAFPGDSFIPAYGPPLAYDKDSNPLSGGKYGGNPNIDDYLMGPASPPELNEAGWKDTVNAPPGYVTRFVIRWGPTDAPANTPAEDLHYAFIPNGPTQLNPAAIFDFVWHCHIVDHEDNEMMRPDAVYIAPVVNAGVDEALPEGVALSSHDGSFRASGSPPWTASVNWGDGSPSEPVSWSATVTSFDFTLPNHTFPSGSGIYTVTVSVTDGTATTRSDTFMVTVTSIDVNPKTINLVGKKGPFKVMIYGSSSFDVSNIDPETLAFGPTAFAGPNSGPSKIVIQDANKDGIPDLLAFFDTPDSLTQGDTSASIWGTIDGLDFVGTTSINTISQGK